MKKLEYKSGQYIFKAGDKGKEIFLLMSGDVGIFLPTNDTKDPNFKVGENEVFGEMGVIDSQLRTASAKAHTDVNLLFVSKEDFDKKIAEGDIVVRGVIAVLSDRLRQLQKK